MKPKNGILWALIVAICAVGAFAASASAEEASFLVSGEATAEGALLIGESELLLEDMKGGIFGEAVKVLCSLLGLFELMLFLRLPWWLKLSTWPLGGTDPGNGSTKVKCTTQTGICPEPEMEDIHLPWLGEVLSGFRLAILAEGAGAPGFNVICNGVTEDQCTGEEATVGLKNVGSSVVMEYEAVFNEHPLNCSRGGAHEGLLEGTETLTDETAGLALAVS